MTPLVEMLLGIISHLVSPETSGAQLPPSFTILRLVDVSQSKWTGDFGPLSIKFVELHGQGLSLEGITEANMDNIRMKYAIDLYEKFIQSLRHKHRPYFSVRISSQN